MAKIRTRLLLLSICLLLTIMAGCQGQPGKTTGTTRVEDGTVIDLLDIQEAVLGSIKIVNMGNGQSVMVEDGTQMDRILKRLAQVQIVENMGDKGYTPTGYELTLTVTGQTTTQEVHIQLDVAEGDDYAAYGGYYYAIDDQATDELNDYFALVKYEYR